MSLTKINTFDYEDIIPEIREAYVTRNLEINRTPELTELAGEFDVPLPTINRFFLAEDWEGQRNQALKDFQTSFSALRKEEIDKRALVLMSEIGRMTKQNVDFLVELKPIIYQKIRELALNPDPKAVKPETLLKMWELVTKQEVGVVDLAIKLKKELDDPDGTGDSGKPSRGGGSLLDYIRMTTKVLKNGKEDTQEEKDLFARLDSE